MTSYDVKYRPEKIDKNGTAQGIYTRAFAMFSQSWATAWAINKSSHCRTLGHCLTNLSPLAKKEVSHWKLVVKSTGSLLDWDLLNLWQYGLLYSSMKETELVLAPDVRSNFC